MSADLSFMYDTCNLSPRRAARELAERCDITIDQAVDSLTMRLFSGRAFSMVKRVAGYTVAGSAIAPSFLPQMIPSVLWDRTPFCSPTSTVWHTGDLRAFVPAGPIMFMGIRFGPTSVDDAAIELDGGCSTAASPSLVPGGFALSPVPFEPKWDWEGAMAALIALAEKPDGLSAIAGLLPLRRGSQAKLETWIRDYFLAIDDKAPSEGEIRKRAGKIVAALTQNGPKGFSAENR